MEEDVGEETSTLSDTINEDETSFDRAFAANFEAMMMCFRTQWRMFSSWVMEFDIYVDASFAHWSGNLVCGVDTGKIYQMAFLSGSFKGSQQA